MPHLVVYELQRLPPDAPAPSHHYFRATVVQSDLARGGGGAAASGEAPWGRTSLLVTTWNSLNADEHSYTHNSSFWNIILLFVIMYHYWKDQTLDPPQTCPLPIIMEADDRSVLEDTPFEKGWQLTTPMVVGNTCIILYGRLNGCVFFRRCTFWVCVKNET